MKKASTKKADARKGTAKKATAKKKAAVKKTTAKKPVAKKTTAKKPVVKKKAAAKKATAKKTAAKKKAVAKKPVAKKKSVAKKTTAKKPVAKKKAAAKKVTAKPAPRKKSVSKKPARQTRSSISEAVKTAPATKAPKAAKISQRDLNKFKKMLIAERDHLIDSINNIEQTSRTESGHDNGADLASFAETGTDSFNIETALNIASSESKRLRDVMDALDRIERGVYGICEGSGKPIPKKRLEAFPSARYCIEYQQELEQETGLNGF